MNNVRVRIAVLTILLVGILVAIMFSCTPREFIRIGIIYDNSEATPYSYDFYLAQEALKKRYGDRIDILMYSNVLDDELGEAAERMSELGCKVIFTNSYGDMLSVANEHPGVQFCQVSSERLTDEDVPQNYHTFKGEIYQGRYVSGVVAGLKLRQMINEGRLEESEATVGFVASLPYAEVISGYTAFLLGVRSVVDTATLRVKYTGFWDNYVLEKACATELIDEGCSIISQHTDTIGPAVACEEYYAREVYHVGFNLDMTDVAPDASLTSARIDWTPYLLGSVEAVITGARIEDVVPGTVHANNDMSGGILDGWIKLTPLNAKLLPEDTEKVVDEVTTEVANGTRQVFFGHYRGSNPTDHADVVDLSVPFIENADSSVPSFRYLLDDVVEIEE